jgi:glycosyltransferase involved in cell wall biosynthesis
MEVEVVAPLGRSPLPGRARHRLDALPLREDWKGLRVHRPRFRQFPYLAGLRPASLAHVLKPLATALRGDFAFDVICAEFAWPDGPAAVALGRALAVPVLIKARGMDFEQRIGAIATRRQTLASARAAQGLLAVSAELKEKMVAAGVPSSRICIHYPGVDGDLFRPGDAAAAKRRLGATGPLLLTVGNLIGLKRQRLAVEALASIEEATLLVAGSGPEAAALQRQARRLGVSGRMRLLGSVPHPLLPSIFGAADVTLHCSAMEGFGNVRLESLACGTPVVTTAAGDAARIIDEPAYGRIVAANPSAIAAAVRELLANPAPRSVVRSAVHDYDWARNAAELEGHLRAAAVAGPATS